MAGDLLASAYLESLSPDIIGDEFIAPARFAFQDDLSAAKLGYDPESCTSRSTSVTKDSKRREPLTFKEGIVDVRWPDLVALLNFVGRASTLAVVTLAC